MQHYFNRILYDKNVQLFNFLCNYIFDIDVKPYKLKFVGLDILGNNFLSWILDAKIHLEAMNLDEIHVDVINLEYIIMDGNSVSRKGRANAIMFICHYLHEI